MITGLIGLGSAIVSGVSGFFGKRQERKKARESAKAKLELAKQQGRQAVELTDAEWETVAAEGLAGSWKDEFVTVIILAPIPMVLIGAVVDAFTADARLLEGTLEGVSRLAELGLDWELLTLAVVFSAIGLKLWRKR
jgi:hypothetical protein